MRLMRTAGVLSALICLGVCTGLLVAEIGLRLARSDGALTASLEAIHKAPGPLLDIAFVHQPSCASCQPETNSLGYPGPEPALRAENRLRVAVVGDSMCVGYGLPWRQTLPAVLERRLAALDPAPGSHEIRVASFCVGGYGLAEYAATVRGIVAPWRPDLVLVLLSSNDGRDALAVQAPVDDVEYAFAPLLPWNGRHPLFGWIPGESRRALATGSYLYQEVSHRLTRFLVRSRPQGGWRMLPDATIDALLTELVTACRGAGLSLGFVLVPNANHASFAIASDRQSDAAQHWIAFNRELDRLGSLSRAQGVRLLDLRPVVEAHASLDLTLGASAPRDRHHFGPAGHAFVAGPIARLGAALLWGQSGGGAAGPE